MWRGLGVFRTHVAISCILRWMRRETHVWNSLLSGVWTDYVHPTEPLECTDRHTWQRRHRLSHISQRIGVLSGIDNKSNAIDDCRCNSHHISKSIHHARECSKFHKTFLNAKRQTKKHLTNWYFHLNFVHFVHCTKPRQRQRTTAATTSPNEFKWQRRQRRWMREKNKIKIRCAWPRTNMTWMKSDWIVIVSTFA